MKVCTVLLKTVQKDELKLNFLILNKDTGRAITSSSVFVAIKSTSKLKQKEQLLGILIIGPNQVLFIFFTKCTCRIVSIKVSLCNVSFLVQKQQKLSTQTVHKDPDDAHTDMDSHLHFLCVCLRTDTHMHTAASRGACRATIAECH